MVQAVWHGTKLEAKELEAALARNCACEYDQGSGARTTCCAGHNDLAHNQRFIDGLLFMRRKAACLQREEWRR